MGKYIPKVSVRKRRNAKSGHSLYATHVCLVVALDKKNDTELDFSRLERGEKDASNHKLHSFLGSVFLDLILKKSVLQ